MIYKLNNKEIKEEIKSFSKTTYGKITFLLSYSVFIITILFFITFILTFYINSFELTLDKLLIIYIITFITILLSFILGSIHFYNKLERFIDKK